MEENYISNDNIEVPPATTGRFYKGKKGRINYGVKFMNDIPWPSGTKIVLMYDKINNEIVIKPLEELLKSDSRFKHIFTV